MHILLVDGQGVGYCPLGNTGLLLVQVVVVAGPGQLLLGAGWERSGRVGDGSREMGLGGLRWRDGGRLVGDGLVLGEVNHGLQRVDAVGLLGGRR